ncbi:MAG TPA: GLUG motif-containing protein [Spirochaetota bacterium]|nr:GLUG motif-containing protein [Spirochaetota bacterium]
MKKIFKSILWMMMFLAALAFGACDDGGGSGSGAGDAQVTAPGAARVTPANLKLKLEWNAVEGATAYEVWYGETNNSGMAIQHGGDITDTNDVIRELDNGTEYFIWLRAKNADGTSDFSDVASGTPEAPADVPGGPGAVIMTGAQAATGSITLSWTDPSEADFDHVEISWSAGSAPVGDTDVDSGLQTYSLTGLSASTKYTVSVVAVDASGNNSGPAEFTIFTAGYSSRNYFFIYSAADLNAVRGGVDGYDGWGLTGNYILMDDLDLGVAPYTDGTGWEPIGVQSNPFSGIFNGNDHVIMNLFIDAPGVDYTGLFGCMSGGDVYDLALESVDVSGGQYTGGLAGANNHGTITNCSTAGTVAGARYTGGLAGSNSGTLSDCFSTATVDGTDHNAGGLAGYNEGTMTYCHATGAVSGDINTGGLVGINSVGEIDDCYATGAVTGNGATTGGLVGYNFYSDVNRSFATGSVSGTGSCGGLVGDNNGNLTDCHAKGAVTGSFYVGGLVGYSFQFTGMGGNDPVMTHCYATGLVTGSSNTGGFAGVSAKGIYANCYYDTETTGQSDTGKGEPRTTREMKLLDSSTIYVGWDFTGETTNGTEDIWTISGSVNSGYPYLTDNH